MNHLFDQLDGHKTGINILATHLESVVSKGNESTLDAHRTTASQIDSLVQFNTASQPRLKLIDRLRDVPITEDVTALHDLLANEVHQVQQAGWGQYEASCSLG